MTFCSTWMKEWVVYGLMHASFPENTFFFKWSCTILATNSFQKRCERYTSWKVLGLRVGLGPYWPFKCLRVIFVSSLATHLSAEIKNLAFSRLWQSGPESVWGLVGLPVLQEDLIGCLTFGALWTGAFGEKWTFIFKVGHFEMCPQYLYLQGKSYAMWTRFLPCPSPRPVPSVGISSWVEPQLPHQACVLM